MIRKIYQSLVGGLNYLTLCCRPDIAYSVCVLAQKASAPTMSDLSNARRVLLYLKKTKNYGINFSRSSLHDVQLKIYVDSSFANGPNRRSINGYIILVNDNVIHWKTKISPMVYQSTTEAEFVAVALMLKDVEWVHNILSEIGINISLSVVFCDNQGAIKIFRASSSTARTKHLDYRLQYIKDLFNQGKYTLKYVTSEDNIADIFTKPLGRLHFNKVLNKIMTNLSNKHSKE